MITATVTMIGSKALDEKEKMLILFGEGATSTLRDYSVIQALPQGAEINLKEGDEISFDDQAYTIQRVGRLANQQVNHLGHMSVVFQAEPEDDTLLNAIYVTPDILPKIKKGTQIRYTSKG